MWRIEFSSAEFLPYLPESAQANPGVYGFELAHWLSLALAKRWIVTSYPMGEDWGWLVEYIEGDVELTIGCSSMAEEGEGYEEKAITWSIFVKDTNPLKPLTRFLGRRNNRKTDGAETGNTPSIARVTAAIEAALLAKGISVQRVE